MPQKYSVSTGFVYGCKRQVDIIIYNSHDFSPFFNEGGIVVVPPQSVRGIIEVKTTLDSDKLKESLRLLSDISTVLENAAPAFTGIFAYKTTYTTAKSLANSIKRYYKNNVPNMLFKQVQSICILNQYNLSTYHYEVDTFYRDKEVFSPRIYKIVSSDMDININGALFLASLFAYLDVNKRAKIRNKHYFGLLKDITKFEFVTLLYNKKWTPDEMYIKVGVEGFTEIDIRDRIEDAFNFYCGNLSMDDLSKMYKGNYVRKRLFEEEE